MSTTVTVGQVLLTLVFLIAAGVSIGLYYYIMRGLDFALRGDDGWWSWYAVLGHVIWLGLLIGWLCILFWALVLR
jgi:hypothetical protein